VKAPSLIGKRFGRITVISQEPSLKYSNCTRARWLCECICGTRTIVFTVNLKNGGTRSCGCLSREVMAKVHRIHGDCSGGRPTPEHDAWAAMIQRCHNPKDHGYKNYGGRGIRVCCRWRRSYVTFLSDVGRRPTLQHSLDRKNNSLGYTPRNVRWATRKEQARNRRGLKFVTVNGVTQCVAAWGEETGVNQITINGRLRRKWPTDKAVSLPPDKTRKACQV